MPGNEAGELVRPLGVFGLNGDAPFELTREELEPLVGSLGVDLRAKIGGYLRSGSIVMPIMEYTTDVLEAKFGVPGGSAVNTDGTYYWRYDTADYVETYGIEIGEDAIEHMRLLGWKAPTVGAGRLREIDQFLSEKLGFSTVDWPGTDS